jgi:hypothetical protein
MVMLWPILMPVLGVVCLAVLVGIFIFCWRTFRGPARSSTRRAFAVLSVVVLGLPVFLCMTWAVRTHLFWSSWARGLNDETERRQRLILYQADHRAVLEAGRQMLADSNAFRSYPATESLPKVLRDLEPGDVLIADDRSSINVEMGGGFFHFGYTIYRDDSAGSGEKQLIPGLWYYSEDRRVIEPKQ